VAAGIIRVAHIRSQANMADILTKPLSPQAYYDLLRWVLFKRESYENQGELQLSESCQDPRVTQETIGDPQASSPIIQSELRTQMGMNVTMNEN